MRYLHTRFAVAAITAITASYAMGQASYPSSTVRIIVPFAAGGQFDAIGRPIADYLTRKLKAPFILESKPGAGSTIGATFVANAAPDGYTLLFGSTSPFAVAPAVYKKISYDPVKSFAPIYTVTEAPLVVVVSPKTGFKSMADLIAAAKAAPGKYTYATPGAGTPPHLLGELLKREAGIDLVAIPFNGGGPAVTALMGGHVDIFFDALTSSVALAADNRLVPLMLTGPTRVQALPNVPTAIEAGLPAMNLPVWNAFAAPAGTPDNIVNLLAQEIENSMQTAEVQGAIERANMSPVQSSPEELAKRISRDSPIWRSIANSVGAVVE